MSEAYDGFTGDTVTDFGLSNDHHRDDKETLEVAKRDKRNLRYDLLIPSFEDMQARIASWGADHYGDYNWQKSRLIGDASPINHIRKHLSSYISNKSYDHPELGTDRKLHLAAIAFNAMMEWWYEEHFPNEYTSRLQSEAKASPLPNLPR